MTEYAKLQRHLLKDGMNDVLKKAFITLVQGHPALPKSDKDFICDSIHHFESISEENRTHVMDVIDEMALFVKRAPIE